MYEMIEMKNDLYINVSMECNEKYNVYECEVMNVKWFFREKVFHLVYLGVYWMEIQLGN